ncbi:MAG: hypothetical protein KGR25_00155 [Chloroflexi bacterium]|nr:hypothetical protein [Chloroflexota bacterium]
MVSLQNIVFGLSVPPIDTNGATTTATGFDTAQITNGLGPSCTVGVLIAIGNIAANATSCIVQEASDSGFTTDLATVVTFTNPTAAGSDNTLLFATINMGARQRYLRAQITGGAGATFVSAVFMALPTGIAPSTAALRGVAQYQNV